MLGTGARGELDADRHFRVSRMSGVEFTEQLTERVMPRLVGTG
ncbi:MAG TPA: hypothetical protein VN748_21685 [Pseudonocardiaceae bacterium]|jgi:hypothetical protein|nr:hypothetical protein [Pseudonocardiaceae bacterium]